MKYHVATFGCQMNEADSQRLASALEKLGLRATDAREEADVLVLNTCVVRQGAEDKALSYLHMIRPLKQRRPDVVIGVMGCLVGVRGNTPLKKAFPWVDVFMAPSEPGPLVDLLLQREGKQLTEVETRQRYAVQDGDPFALRLPQHEIGKRVTAN
jgi:tRNA-2-methylthio-N6-dimethylallyladenosine synthase